MAASIYDSEKTFSTLLAEGNHGMRGPSDSSDSGSDLAGTGAPELRDDSDRHGTGEAPSIDDVRMNADVDVDRVVNADQAGLGGGLDQAEEAQLGITDEEIAENAQAILDLLERTKR